ncbi:MAG: anti-sigma factor domain-containing protein [Gaiellaceae bacterium]
MTDFDEIVDRKGLTPDEEARLRRVHRLLVQAGPPADLPPALERLPVRPTAEVIEFPLLPKRRWAAGAVLAAALAAIAFGGGYLFGHSKTQPATLATKRVVAMHGNDGALALLKVAARDSVGNWPMEIEVTDLPKQAQRSSYYELWLTKGHRPTEPCGTFRVNGKTTTVRFTVPYSLDGVDGWVVTNQRHGDSQPGPVVLRT